MKNLLNPKEYGLHEVGFVSCYNKILVVEKSILNCLYFKLNILKFKIYIF